MNFLPAARSQKCVAADFNRGHGADKIHRPPTKVEGRACAQVREAERRHSTTPTVIARLDRAIQ
jgi:hypothetical protein